MRQRTVTVEEAGSGLERWISAAGRGETVVITRGGRPVATLIGPGASAHPGEPDVHGLDAALVSLLAWEDTEEMLRFLGES